MKGPHDRLRALLEMRDTLMALAADEQPNSHEEMSLIGTAASLEQGAQSIAEEHEIARRQMSFLDIAEAVDRRRTAAQ